MRWFWKAKDGGKYSTVTGYWLVEAKRLFSVVLLRFGPGTRENFHSHAFNGISWVLRGRLTEEHRYGDRIEYRPSWWPVITKRDTFHRVRSEGTSWVLNFRGPGCANWWEYDPVRDVDIRMAPGRVVLYETDAKYSGL